MGDGPNLLVCRLSIFFGMIAAAVTLIYLAPVPKQSFKNCDRPCHELDWPMICRFKIVIEKLPTSVICQNCQKCPFCSSANEMPQQILTANRNIPAPPIHVCHNDIVVVDVINKLEGQSLTIHWRGQTNLETPFMDGVPLITQCPINPYSTFQYKFRASSPGTHSYHAFSDSDRTSGLYGALIVRKPKRLEENIENFQVDNKHHVLVLAEGENSILINGIGPSGAPLSTYSIEEGTTNRFRVIHASGTGCSLSLILENHLLKVISVDGNPIESTEAYSIKLSKGESLDFILTANQSPSSYFFEVRSNCNSKNLIGKAMVTYVGTPVDSKIKTLGFVGNLRKFDTTHCVAKNGKTCLGDIRSTEGIDESLKSVDKRIYLGFDRKKEKSSASISLIKSYQTNNISFIFPPSPILTQPTDIPEDLMCNEAYLPDRCRGKGTSTCDCVHLEHIPLGSSTEIVLVDQGGGEEEDGYTFHLHGYQFYVVGSKIMKSPITKLQVKKLDTNFDFIKRNFNNPIKKSTVKVPKNGMIAIRFLANNPGFWILRDENAKGWTRGLDILFQVGDTGDIAQIPTEFPTCGNFIGPDFFLL